MDRHDRCMSPRCGCEDGCATQEAANDEREACAKIADTYSEQAKRERWTGENVAGRTAAAVASMIRSRAIGA